MRSLFELAEDSAQELDGYIHTGTVLVAVLPSHQRCGIGRALVEAAARSARGTGRASLLVATAAADTGNLRF